MKLKPLVLLGAPKHGKTKQKLFQQNLLLKALEHTTDIKELKKIAKFHTDAEVYRTLDKLSIRREYHEALARNGMGLDTLVGGIKDLCLNAEKDDTKLKAYQFILKSIGLDKYEATETQGKNWEEIILQIDAVEASKRSEKRHLEAIDGNLLYEVSIPEIPMEVIERKKQENEMNTSLYEGKNANREIEGS